MLPTAPMTGSTGPASPQAVNAPSPEEAPDHQIVDEQTQRYRQRRENPR
jgi:hypothetical protein